jgi:hypothetical protein
MGKKSLEFFPRPKQKVFFFNRPFSGRAGAGYCWQKLHARQTKGQLLREIRNTKDNFRNAVKLNAVLYSLFLWKVSNLLGSFPFASLQLVIYRLS